MAKQTADTLGTKSTFNAADRRCGFFSLKALEQAGIGQVGRLPFSLKILLENLLRNEDGVAVTRRDIEALANWEPRKVPDKEIAFSPARVILQDFTGVPAVVDLAAMRDAVAHMGGDPSRINPLVPAELVIDHSVQVDSFGRAVSLGLNLEKEYERNRERYTFLRWGQAAFDNLQVVPPGTGIVHQVNIEYLARVVFDEDTGAEPLAYFDTLVGTDSHTTMVNGLGVLGWGVGGIEAEAAMLGQPITMLIPQVIGFRLSGSLPEGTTATDLVLTVTEILRRKGVVGKFVEFFGPGVSQLSLADRATIANMAPEFGATCAIFPIDRETIEYLRATGRPERRLRVVEEYAKAQGVFHTPEAVAPVYSDTVELDLAIVESSIAGPRRPQDRVPLKQAKSAFDTALPAFLNGGSARASVRVSLSDKESPEVAEFDLKHGSVVIAAITSCTNTSNPNTMIGAGLIARKAVEKGLRRKPWVKTSLAPGSKVVTEYLNEAGLTPFLEQLGFHLVGYGCTTCIGNSGPLPTEISRAVGENDLVVCSVLSGNRNFEGRINPDVRANYLASPPLVVAYALAGRMDIDLLNEPLGQSESGTPVYLRDIWPTQAEISQTVREAVKSEMFSRKYSDVFTGDERWQTLPIPTGSRYQWDSSSTYVKNPPFFENLGREPGAIGDVSGMRVLAMLGDSVTTDHISPAGSIPKNTPAGMYLMEHGISPLDFNSYGARRGNHEVMMRGTFANIRLRNLLCPGKEGGYTVHPSSPEPVSIYAAAMLYKQEGVPLMVIAGKEYGTGSSRDWAAKGTALLGVRAVLAESFERIHRSNLVGMGVLPLQFKDGENRETLRLTGSETYDIAGLATGLTPGQTVRVTVQTADGSAREFQATVRVDTPNEVAYYRHGGILPYVIRSLIS